MINNKLINCLSAIPMENVEEKMKSNYKQRQIPIWLILFKKCKLTKIQINKGKLDLPFNNDYLFINYLLDNFSNINFYSITNF